MTPFDAKMAELRRKFVQRCPAEAAGLATARAKRDRDEVIGRAHKLAGLAGTLDFNVIGNAAAALEAAGEAGDSIDDLSRALIELLERADENFDS